MKKMLLSVLVISLFFNSVVFARGSSTLTKDTLIETKTEKVFINGEGWYTYRILENDSFRVVKVVGENSIDTIKYDKNTGEVLVNDENKTTFISNECEDLSVPYATEYIKTDRYEINVVGMSAGAIVGAIVAKLGGGIKASAIAGAISSAVADNIIKSYISIKVHHYWDPDTINQSRPRYWNVTEIYAGKNFDRHIITV